MDFNRIYEETEHKEEALRFEVTVTCKYHSKVQRFSWSVATEKEALALCGRKKADFLASDEFTLLKIEFNKICKPITYYEA